MRVRRAVIVSVDIHLRPSLTTQSHMEGTTMISVVEKIKFAQIKKKRNGKIQKKN
jgi:hypothetical protein